MNKENLNDDIIRDVLQSKFKDFEYETDLTIESTDILKKNKNTFFKSIKPLYWIGGLTAVCLFLVLWKYNYNDNDLPKEVHNPKINKQVVSTAKRSEMKKSATNGKKDLVAVSDVSIIHNKISPQNLSTNLSVKDSSTTIDTTTQVLHVIEKSNKTKVMDFKSFVDSHNESEKDTLQLFIRKK